MELILNVYVKEFLSDAHYKYKFKYFIDTNTSIQYTDIIVKQ